MNRRLAGAIASSVLAVSLTARADDHDGGFSIGSKPAYFVSGGLTTGASIVARDRGYYLGGELSVLRLNRGYFIGLYGDGYYDFGASRTYSTAGVELGYKFLGIDGGAAARFGDDHVALGPTGRVFVTVGIVSIYARYAYFYEPERAKDDHVVQIGALLKFPFAAWGG